MNAAKRTLIFAAVAALSVTVALSTWYSNRPNVVDGFAEVGEPFFAEFEDPTRATSLQVTVFDNDANEANSFSVRQNDDGLWVIPSHHSYPAEAADRLAQTATSFIGVTKSAVQSRSKEDWKAYGVIDPAEEDLSDGSDCGTRVTLADASGNPLVDLIVGNPVPDREKTFYVREPGKNTTYLAELDVELTAKFSDWIEPDLLKVTQTDIVRMVKDNYFIDEAQGVIKQGETLTFEKEDLKSTGSWTLTDLDDETEEIVASPISALARNMDQLKIVGVRPKPEGINADLTVDPEVARNPLLLQVLQADMQKQGFYVAPDTNDKVRLFSNEGELIAGTDKGVEYTLYFGEIARGSGKDVEVGFSEESAEDDSETDADDESADDSEQDADETETDSEEGPRRYLLVKVRFDDSLLGPKPVEPTAPEKPAILNESPDDDGEAAEATGSDDKGEPKGPDDAEAGEAKSQDKPSEEGADDDADEPAAEESAEDDACLVDESESTQEDEPQEETPSENPTGADESAFQESGESKQENTAEGSVEPAAKEEADTSEATPEGAATQEDAGLSNAAQESPEEAAAGATQETQPEVDPKQQAQAEYDAAMGEYEAAKRAYETDLKDWEARAEEGRKNAEELNVRFAGWYYVISAESFEKFKVSRMDVTKMKEADGDSESPGDASTPPFTIPEQ